MLRKDDRGIYRASRLEQLPWLEHGFGTRDSGDWAPNTTTLKQIHSAIVVKADTAGVCAGEGDALITDRPGTLLAVRTADCIPILLADERRKAVAAVHAGWRGTVAGVASRAIEAMGQNFESRPEDLWVAIGPGIGPCCYEVGPEVAREFRRLFPERCDLEYAARIDLPGANRRQFAAAGVALERIVSVDACTFCHPGEFHSWRRDRTQGRMVSAIGIKA